MGSLRAFAELQSYCSDLPDTPEGRFERVMVALIFDTGIPRWELADADLSAIDLDAGQLTIDVGKFTLTPFTVAAVREWMAGHSPKQAERAKPTDRPKRAPRQKRQPRGSSRRAAG